MVRRIQGGRGAVARELNALVEVGFLVREERANLVVYWANRDCPVYNEIHSLIVKTAGVADVLHAYDLDLQVDKTAMYEVTCS